MADKYDIDRIQALAAAARVERAKVVRRVLRGLMGRRNRRRACHPWVRPAVGDCR